MSKLIQLIHLAEATARIPNYLKPLTYYSATDSWMYETSDHPNICDDCETNVGVYAGTELRAKFPYHIVVDENFIFPKVHPHCGCGLVRLYPVDVDSPGDTYMEAPKGNTTLSPETEQRLMQLPLEDYDDVLDGMLAATYITASLYDVLTAKRRKERIQKQQQKEKEKEKEQSTA